ncbi:MAG: SAM-dependent methyltransferase [Clostridia bacterium]
MDVACGKGEMLLRLAERVRIGDAGVDLSPYAVREARERAAHRRLRGRIEVLEAGGQGYVAAAEAGRYDLAMCVGRLPSAATGPRLRPRRGSPVQGTGAGGRDLQTPDPEHLTLAAIRQTSLRPMLETWTLGLRSGFARSVRG